MVEDSPYLLHELCRTHHVEEAVRVDRDALHHLKAVTSQ